MGRRPNQPPDDSFDPRPTATTPQGRENQMINLAMNAVERRIREGTASAQELTHFLKLGSSREKLEQKRIAGEIELNVAKIQQIASIEEVKELYTNAMASMRRYSGDFSNDGVDDYEDD